MRDNPTSSRIRTLPRPLVSVLVVDASPGDRELYEAMLHEDPSAQYALLDCATGAEAIARVRAKIPDCILLDYHLPDGTAPELLEQLGKIVDLGTLPVVVTTDSESPRIIESVFRAGAVDFVQKSKLSSADLCRTLRYAVERARHQNMRSQLARSQRLMSLGQVAASVAHEINNPAAFMLSNLAATQDLLGDLRSELLKSCPEIIPLVDELGSITQDNIDGIRRIAAIVGELRQFSHPKTESVESVDLADVVRIAAKLLGQKLASAGSLDIDLPNLPRIFADRGRLVQVFVNLLDNAAMALRDTTRETRRVFVHGGLKGDWIELKVSDNGSGMSAEVAAHALEPFYTTKVSGQGTGLGLSLCAEYVHLHGGEIELASTPGVGTTVTVRVPLVTGLVPSSDRAPKSLSEIEHGGLVVVIDDEAPLLRAFQRVLAGHHQVATFERARDALASLRAGLQATVIVCDVNMPDMDGPSLYRELSEHLPALARRVIFCTGGAFTETSRKLLEETGLEILSKPIEPALLLKAIARVQSAARER